MRAGLLREKCTIQSLTETKSSTTGEMVKSYADTLSNIWCRVLTVSGGESFDGRERVTSDVKMFVIRYTTTALKTNMRISYDSKYYDIKFIDNENQRDREIRITAELVE